MKNILIVTISILLAIGLVISSCSSNDNNEEKTFDRKIFLENYANNILKPRVNEFASIVDVLDESINIYSNNPTVDQLKVVQENYIKTIKYWQKITFMNFGPGDRQGLKFAIRDEVAVYPINVEIIEDKITLEKYELEDYKRNSRGLLAIEYLLYPFKDVNKSFSFLDSKRINYLVGISQKVKEQVNEFRDKWETYPEEFIAKDGTSVESSTSRLYNRLFQGYEYLNHYKLIQPLGLEASQTKKQPTWVESNFAGLSLELARANFEDVIEVYKGGDGIGFDDYLLSVKGGKSTVDAIDTQVSVIRLAFDDLPQEKTLKELIIEEDESILKLQKEIQKLIPHFKSEISSLLGLGITYTVNDGD